MFKIFKSLLFTNRKVVDDKSLKNSFKKIKNEFDEHLDTINQNTNEIQANYEYVCELDSKMDKIMQRLDEIQMGMSNKEPVKSFNLEEPISDLTKREQEVFMVLYTNESGNLTYSDIARRLGLKEDMVRNYISGLSSKGVPILKKFVSNKVFLMLDHSFKDFQTKENVLQINENLAKQFV